MTANDIAAKYTLAKLSEMYCAAAKELQQVDEILHNGCISETMRMTSKAYKDTLTEYAKKVFDAMTIKETM